MNPPFLALGVALLAAAVVDLLWTTLWVDGGAGPISSRLMAGVWRGLRAIGDGRSRVLGLAGPLLVMVSFVAWIGLLWAGWTLVFASTPEALIDTRGPQSVSWFDLAYFAAYSIFTLGIGDVVPREGVWQLVTILATGSGMLFVTMSVSYVISVIGAVSRKRAFASSVTALGDDSAGFVRTGWTGEDFRGFELTINALAQEVDYLAYQYKAYPILHYYHTRTDGHAAAVGIAIFDEALTLLRCGIPENERLNTALVVNAHSSTYNYLETLSDAFIEPADRAPPPPDLDRLRDDGIPTVSDAAFAADLDDLEDRRRRLLGMVQADAREWPDAER